MSTLESAGFLYNPFTKNDIWGGPAQLALKPLLAQELPVGADDGALRQMTDPGLLQGAPVAVSSGAVIPQVQNRYQRKREEETSSQLTYLALFGVILLAALYFRVPGSA